MTYMQTELIETFSVLTKYICPTASRKTTGFASSFCDDCNQWSVSPISPHFPHKMSILYQAEKSKKIPRKAEKITKGDLAAAHPDL